MHHCPTTHDVKYGRYGYPGNTQRWSVMGNPAYFAGHCPVSRGPNEEKVPQNTEVAHMSPVRRSRTVPSGSGENTFCCAASCVAKMLISSWVDFSGASSQRQ